MWTPLLPPWLKIATAIAPKFGIDTSMGDTGNIVHKVNQAAGGALPQFNWLDQLMNQQSQQKTRRQPMLASALGRYGGLG